MAGTKTAPIKYVRGGLRADTRQLDAKIAAFVDQALSDRLDQAFGTTRGSVIYRGENAWTALAPGTSGHVLTSAGAGADLSYTNKTPTVLQIQSVENSAPTSTTAAIPLDDTAPQITEGAQLTLKAFTPLDAASKIKIEWHGFIASGPSEASIAAAFIEGTADALVTRLLALSGPVSLTVIIDSWGLTAKTISIRYGNGSGGTSYANQYSTGVDFGETMSSTLTITEYKNPS